MQLDPAGSRMGALPVVPLFDGDAERGRANSVEGEQAPNSPAPHGPVARAAAQQPGARSGVLESLDPRGGGCVGHPSGRCDELRRVRNRTLSSHMRAQVAMPRPLAPFPHLRQTKVWEVFLLVPDILEDVRAPTRCRAASTGFPLGKFRGIRA
jgi:hypothetical protein